MAESYLEFVAETLILHGRQPTDDEDREFWRQFWQERESKMGRSKVVSRIVRFADEYWWLIVGMLLIFGFACLIGFLRSSGGIGPGIHNEGRAAFQVGVPSTANPYSFRSAVEGSIWLNGWVEAAGEAKQEAGK